ncbi:MAG: radical SAM protein [Actinomycetota bacterium]
MQSPSRRLNLRACLVVVDGAGVGLHPVETTPPWVEVNTSPRRLDHTEVRALADMAAHGAVDGHDDLLDALDRMGLLVDTPQEGAVGAAPLMRGTVGAGDDVLVLRSPLVLGLSPRGYVLVDHDGDVDVTLSPDHVLVAAAMGMPSTVDGVAGSIPDLDPADIAATIGALRAHGIVELPDGSATIDPAQREIAASIRSAHQLATRVASEAAARDESDPDKIPVYCVLPGGTTPPLSLGMVISRAKTWENGRLRELYDLEPRWINPNAPLDDHRMGPAVYLFSNYIWSHQDNLDCSRRIKERNPDSVMIHGGPDTPSYAADVERYFARHDQVDIAVLGEGEETASVLLDALGEALAAGCWSDADLSAVEGIAARSGDGVLRTGSRDRLADLNVVPSPYLDGTFDAFDELESIGLAIIETNRGCPYGCTFCDWGSATNSRIRKFDLDRTFAELEWCATHGVDRIFVADANFGIFARDVEIAQKVADLKREHGFPGRLITNYAKNTVKHLREIVQIISEAGILTEGLLSLQSTDEDTLTAIRRSNIKLEKYESLAAEFRGEGLPLFVDLMLGLPGQTPASLLADFRQCVDREVLAKCHGTELLVNSPMNQPEYREEHALISTRPPGPTAAGESTGPALVVSTSSFTREDYSEMHRMRRSYLLGENLGVFRYVGRFLHQELGLHEVDLIEAVRRTSAADPARWPALRLATATVPDAMVPPVSWRYFVDELRALVIDELGANDDSALRSVIAAQHALLPAPRRSFPTIVDLEHDFSAWIETLTAAKLDGHGTDWPQIVPRLSTYGPGRLEVTDPTDVCGSALGQGSAIAAYKDWELASVVARPTPSHHKL